MTDQLLDKIIALEKRLQRQLDQERARAADWQERELAALDARLEAAEAQAGRLDEQTLAAARAQCECDAAAMVKAATAQAKQLAALDQTTLKRHLWTHLQAILPEAGDDHPHGQS